MPKYIHYFCSRKINCCCHLIGTSSVTTGFLFFTVILPFFWLMHILLWHLPGEFFLWPYVLVISTTQKHHSRHAAGSNTSQAIWALLQALCLLCRTITPPGPAVPPQDVNPESPEDTGTACQGRVKQAHPIFRFFTAFISLSKIFPYLPNDMGSLLFSQQSTESTQLLVPVLSGAQPKIQWYQMKYGLPSISEWNWAAEGEGLVQYSH